MENFFIVLTTFATPVALVAVVKHYKLKSQQLAAGVNVAEQKALAARYEELEARMQTLETIVCEGDLDAAAKIRALASREQGTLPAARRRELLTDKDRQERQ